MSKPIIRPDSPEAATYRTDIKGWVSRHGRYFGDDPGAERVARWDGATVGLCNACGAETDKTFTRCGRCREAQEVSRYLAMPVKPHDGGMVYSGTRDKYFDALDDAIEWVRDHDDEQSDRSDAEILASLRLVLCDPVYARTLDGDFFADDLPPDEDLPTVLEAAIDAFNAAVKGVVVAWEPSRCRVDLTDCGVNNDGTIAMEVPR